MSRPKRFRPIVLIFLSVAVAYIVLTAPRAARRLDADASWSEVAVTTVPGAFHVHSSRSDGTGTVDEIAAAAARAGLRFVIITDHISGTGAPDAPAYRSGVLCIDGVEISTTGGHYVAIGLGAAPYPLGGEPRDVVADVARFGGFGVAAHPGSAKPELAWNDWQASIDGLEWLNADSEWRDEGWPRLLHALTTYPWRPSETLVSLLDRPDPVLQQWDQLTARRRVTGWAGSDAHARIGPRAAGDPYDDAVLFRLPSYERVFRAFSMRALLDRPLTGEAAPDAEALLSALRGGRAYTAVDGLATPALLEFAAEGEHGRARMGESLAQGAAGLHARVNAPDATLILRRNGGEVLRVTGPALSFDHRPGEEGAAYRVEVTLPDGPGRPPVPWIVSNPIYIGIPDAPPSVLSMEPTTTPARRRLLLSEGSAEGWTVEHESTSRAAAEGRDTPAGRELAFRYALATLRRLGPYAALMYPFRTPPAGFDRATFRIRADRRMRLSFQLRAQGAGAGDRWSRSIYVDEITREVSVPFDDMRPMGQTRAPRPELDRVDALLFAVDLVNTAPGTAGVVWLDDVRLEQSGMGP
jgi:hypothetical protein